MLNTTSPALCLDQLFSSSFLVPFTLLLTVVTNSFKIKRETHKIMHWPKFITNMQVCKNSFLIKQKECLLPFFSSFLVINPQAYIVLCKLDHNEQNLSLFSPHLIHTWLNDEKCICHKQDNSVQPRMILLLWKCISTALVQYLQSISDALSKLMNYKI